MESRLDLGALFLYYIALLQRNDVDEASIFFLFSVFETFFVIDFCNF